MTSGRIALVTGASRGLGRAVGRALGASGAHVVALARTVGGLEELADEVAHGPGGTTLVPLDLTDDGGLARMCRAIHDRWGRLDLVVHCAAHAAPLSPADHVAEKDLDRAFAVNARATQRLILMTAPLLRAAPSGQFVHVTDSVAGHKFQTAYGSSKAAAEAMAQSFAAESARIGPRVAIFRPAAMPTALRARFYPGEDRSRLTPCETEAARLLAEVVEPA